MKKKTVVALTGVALAVTLVVTGGYFANEHIQLQKYKNTPLSLSKKFRYTAHTGCSGTKDNSLESMEAGIQYGAGIIEFDLNFDENGNPVLSHNEPQGGEITLDEAFELLSSHPDTLANVDVKNTANLQAVEVLAEKYGVLGQIFYTGIEEKDAETAKTDSPKVSYYLNIGDIISPKKHTREYILTLVEKVKKCGAVGINFHYNSASQLLVDVFHEEGLLVSIWTVDSEKDLYRILSYGPDNITTKKPELLQNILSE